MITKILMVCLGNICRSPLAEGILRSKVNSDTILVDSAGTAGYHVGNAPDRRSIAVARKYGVDISQQVCRKFTVHDFENFDVIYAMDLNNYDNILALSRNQKQAKKVHLLLSDSNGKKKEVPDPYYDSADGFEKVFHLIDHACNRIIKQL